MTDTSRRALLRAGALGVLAAPFVPTEFAAAAATSLYSRSRFKKLVNAKFTLTGAGGTFTVTLARVSDLPGAAAGADNAFGLTFTTPQGGPAQGTYTIKRSGFTATQLFLVPSDAARHTHQAIVNRSTF